MYEIINEKIDVVAIFGRGFLDAKPFRLKWQGRSYTITQIGYKHKLREGQKIIHVFSCTDGATFFELRFDGDDLKWILAKVWDGQAG